jgi:hypothetical protein
MVLGYLLISGNTMGHLYEKKSDTFQTTAQYPTCKRDMVTSVMSMSSILEVARGVKTPHRKKAACYEIPHRASELGLL